MARRKLVLWDGLICVVWMLSLERMNLEEGTQPFTAERPLATVDSILAGTFSSDDSETARARMEQSRGIPGSLMGPLAAPLGPVVLSGDPGGMGADDEQRALQGRAAEALAVERLRFSQELPPPGLVQVSSVLQGSASVSMQSSAAPRGSLSVPMQLSVAPQGSSSVPMQLSAAPQGSSSVPMQLSAAPQGSFAAPLQLSDAPQGSSAVPMQLSDAPQGSLSAPMQSSSAPQGSTTALLPSSTEDQGCRAGPLAVGERLQEASQTSYVSAVSECELKQDQAMNVGVAKFGGLTIGAPPTGLVFVQGTWRPYMMVQGQMVIQTQEAAGVSAVGLSLAAPTFTPESAAKDVGGGVPPPPPPPPPRADFTYYTFKEAGHGM